MEKLYIVIPAYNEQDTIEKVIDDWYPVVEKIGGESKLVIINDGSKDRTAEILERCGESHERLIGLTKENGGHGAAVLYGYRYALIMGRNTFFRRTQTVRPYRRNFGRFGSFAETMIW